MSDLSLKAAHDRRLDLEAKAERSWKEYAKRLEELIPESLIPFAKWLRWIEKENDPVSMLPEFFANLIRTTMAGRSINIVVYSNNLARFGMTRFSTLAEALRELKLAWDDTVIIKIKKSKSEHQMELHFYATEFIRNKNFH